MQAIVSEVCKRCGGARGGVLGVPGGGFPGELTLEMRHQVVVVVGHFGCWHSLLL